METKKNQVIYLCNKCNIPLEVSREFVYDETPDFDMCWFETKHTCKNCWNLYSEEYTIKDIYKWDKYYVENNERNYFERIDNGKLNFWWVYLVDIESKDEDDSIWDISIEKNETF